MMHPGLAWFLSTDNTDPQSEKFVQILLIPDNAHHLETILRQTEFLRKLFFDAKFGEYLNDLAPKVDYI